MKYSSLTKKVGNETFVFITRGRSKPFDDAEVNEYLKQRLKDFSSFPVEITEKPPLRIRDELRQMFLKDMRQFGVQHCAGKYGGTSKEIIAEAARVAPYMTQGFKE